ncbi:MAG: hypothetical protein AAGF25_04295 [Pseudomonadota bacterium]
MERNEAVAEVTSAEIKDALERVLGSKSFVRSARARELLRYLVEEEQAGNGGLLKGFSIAQDVFGKDDEFDPSTDAVVRVQAGRLRENLAAYYGSDGAQDPVKIEIPRGTYIPTYETGQSIADGASISASGADGREKLDFGTPVASLSLDDDAISIGANSPVNHPIVAPVPVNPFVVTAIRRFSIGIVVIFILLAAILYAVVFNG